MSDGLPDAGERMHQIKKKKTVPGAKACPACGCPRTNHVTWGGQAHRHKTKYGWVSCSSWHGYCMSPDCGCVIQQGDNRSSGA